MVNFENKVRKKSYLSDSIMFICYRGRILKMWFIEFIGEVVKERRIDDTDWGFKRGIF